MTKIQRQYDVVGQRRAFGKASRHSLQNTAGLWRTQNAELLESDHETNRRLRSRSMHDTIFYLSQQPDNLRVVGNQWLREMPQKAWLNAGLSRKQCLHDWVNWCVILFAHPLTKLNLDSECLAAKPFAGLIPAQPQHCFLKMSFHRGQSILGCCWMSNIHHKLCLARGHRNNDPRRWFWGCLDWLNFFGGSSSSASVVRFEVALALPKLTLASGYCQQSFQQKEAKTSLSLSRNASNWITLKLISSL